jgi:hypothetical protein
LRGRGLQQIGSSRSRFTKEMNTKLSRINGMCSIRLRFCVRFSVRLGAPFTQG